MRAVIVELVSAVREVVTITFIKPVRDGRPHPSTWPAGLSVIGVAVMMVSISLGLAAIFAGPLRRLSHLVIDQALPDLQLPAAVIPLLLCGVVLSLALTHTAAVRTVWWARAAVIVIGATVLFTFSGWSMIEQPWAIWISVAIYLSLCVFMFIRSTRQFAWWEFMTITILMSCALFFPWTVADPLHDIRVTVLPLTLVNLTVLAVPALVVAGVAPAQVIVTGAAAAAGRSLPRGVFWLMFAAAVAWLALESWRALDGALPPSWVGGIPELIAVAVGMAVWLARARRASPAQPGEYPTSWMRWLYPLAIAIVGFQLIGTPVSTLVGHFRMFGGVAASDVWNTALNVFSATNGGVLWRGVIGVVLLVLCWRISGKGRATEASLLGAVSVSFLLQAIGLMPGMSWLLESSPRGMALIAAATALSIAVFLGIRRQLTRSSAAAALCVVLLAALYPYRDVLSDLGGATLGLSAQLLVLFGLTWRVLTGGDFRERSTRLLPYPSRVLLFMANSLLAVTLLAFMALSRTSGTVLDPVAESEVGAWTLGEPLFTVALVAGVWLTLRPVPTSSVDRVVSYETAFEPQVEVIGDSGNAHPGAADSARRSLPTAGRSPDPGAVGRQP